MLGLQLQPAMRLWAFSFIICLSPLHSRLFISSIIPSSVLLVPISLVITLLIAYLAPDHLPASLLVPVLCRKKTSEISFALMFPKSSQTAFSTQAPQVCNCAASVPGATLIYLSSAGIMETLVQSIMSTPQYRKLQ